MPTIQIDVLHSDAGEFYFASADVRLCYVAVVFGVLVGPRRRAKGDRHQIALSEILKAIDASPMRVLARLCYPMPVPVRPVNVSHAPACHRNTSPRQPEERQSLSRPRRPLLERPARHFLTSAATRRTTR